MSIFAPTTKEITTMTQDAHHSEYLGAVAGMQDTYGTGWNDTTNTPPTLAVGDFISGMTCGKRWSGRIEWIDGDRITIDVGGGWVAVSASDVTF
jgi:hypothetical protein